MENKELLKRLGKFNPKLAEKYDYLLDKWWKVPEEDFIYAHAGMRVYTGLSIAMWVVSSIGIIFTVISVFNDSPPSTIAGVIVAAIFGLVGLYQLNTSNKYKKIYLEEKEKYDRATREHHKTDRALLDLKEKCELDISDQLYKGLSKSDTFKELAVILDSILITIRNYQNDFNKLYNESKVYEYNFYEIKEIEAFKEVDSYMTLDSIYEDLHLIEESVMKSKSMAEEKNDKGFQTAIENLLDLLPNPEED